MNPPPLPLPPPPPRPPPPLPQLPPPPPPLSHNPNPFFPPSTTTTATSTSNTSNLPTALSTLTSLLHLSHSTLSSLPTTTTTPTPTLIPCPFNPNHHLPPSSIFTHYLNCPSSPSPLLSSLHCPHPTTSLSSTLETHFAFASNFFYSDCPAVVTHPNNHRPPPPLVLPEVLPVKCNDSIECNARGLSIGCSIRLLPSEVWAIRNEVEEWRDYPNSYSYCVFRAILVIENTSLVNFSTWVIVNSPKYGVVIDFATRDHIVLLFKLCLKAIVEEASGYWESLFSVEVKENDKGVNARSFSCAVLGQVLMWLASQLGVLYGEMNGKFFAINMLKQCVLDASFGSSLFAELKDLEKVDCTAEEGVENRGEIDRESLVGETIGKSKIVVSQVAAAIAALHERSMLEEKIRALRDTRPLTAYQRMLEHETITKVADEERKRRPDYRPLTEHDVFLRHQSFNEETNKMKTREEILAEERDYKRRRMSYRGKKLKRSTTEKMRDIIDIYMEEMKRASGIGCSAKGSEEREALVSQTLPVYDSSADIYKQTKNLVDSSDNIRRQPHSDRKLLDSRYDMPLVESKDIHKRDSRSYRGHLEPDRSIRSPRLEEYNTRSSGERRSRHNGEEYSRSPDKNRSRRGREDYPRSPDRSRPGREDYSRSPDKRVRKSKRDREDYSKSPDRRRSKRDRNDDSKKLFSSNKRHGHQREERGDDSELKRRGKRKSPRNHRSASGFQDRYKSIERDEFEDRYNPVE